MKNQEYYYQYRDRVSNYASWTKEEQDRFIDVMRDPTNMRGWAYSYTLYALMPHISTELFSGLACQFIKNADRYVLFSRYGKEIIQKSMTTDLAQTRHSMLVAKNRLVRSFLLTIPNISEDEEEQGLRAISGGKFIPFQIYDNKFKPRLEVLKRLPTMMRLKAIEALFHFDSKITYGIFESITEDDFHALIFSASMKYPDRVKQVSDTYKELKYRGIKATVRISGECSKCGEFEVAFTSGMSRTEAGLKRTGIGRILTYDGCPICYNRSTLVANKKFEIEE